MTTNEAQETAVVIGYDPGFGNTKVCVAGRIGMLQSAVSRPKSVGLATIGMRAASHQVPLVEFADNVFAVGPGSWNRGEPLTSLDYNSLVAPERLALFYAALGSAGFSATVPAMLCVGLPVPLLQDKAQATIVLDSLKRFRGNHHFTIGHKAHDLEISRVKVLAQPVGAYVNWLYDDQLNARSNGNKAEIAILDIGFNTLDLYAIANGQVSERHIGGAEVGVHRLLDLLLNDGHDLAEIDLALREATIRPEGGQLDMWLGEILAAVKRTWSSLKRFTAVIPTGGGALILGDKLKVALAAKGAAVHWPDDPLTANVRGFWKYGVKNVGNR
jgi:hypothetical protein